MKKDKKYIWDYNVKSLDLKKPQALHWYLARKINFGDWKSLDKKTLKKNLKYLDINPTLKKMLTNYYANKRAKTSSRNYF